jgi:hypothetical protein
MSTQIPPLSADQAVGEFFAIVHEELGDPDPNLSLPPQTPEQAETSRFKFAEFVIAMACPDPRAGADTRCRRDRQCRHFAYLRDKEQRRVSTHPRRTPGAEAIRYAIWVYMNSGK